MSRTQLTSRVLLGIALLLLTRGALFAQDVVITTSGTTVPEGKLKASSLVVNALCNEGIRVAGKAVLKQPSVTGARRLDVLTGKRPKLRNTTCGTSAPLLPDGGAGATWGVCAND